MTRADRDAPPSSGYVSDMRQPTGARGKAERMKSPLRCSDRRQSTAHRASKSRQAVACDRRGHNVGWIVRRNLLLLLRCAMDVYFNAETRVDLRF